MSLSGLDLLLEFLHLGLVLFVLTGWMVPALRRLHLAVLAVVWLSWIGLGLYVGNLGYCALTDWHWQVKSARGETHLPLSYLEYLYWQLGGQDVNDNIISWLAAAVLIAVTCIALLLAAKTRRPR